LNVLMHFIRMARGSNKQRANLNAIARDRKPSDRNRSIEKRDAPQVEKALRRFVSEMHLIWTAFFVCAISAVALLVMLLRR